MDKKSEGFLKRLKGGSRQGKVPADPYLKQLGKTYTTYKMSKSRPNDEKVHKAHAKAKSKLDILRRTEERKP